MKNHVFWLTSLVFVSSAIGLHLGALRSASGGRDIHARAAASTENRGGQLKAEAKRLANNSAGLAFAGFISALLSVACLFISFRSHEPASGSAIAGLLAIYLLLQFIIV